MALVPYQEIPTSSEELWLLITHSPTIRDTVLSTLLLISRLLHHPILLSQLLHHLHNQALHLNSHLFLCVFSRIRLFETMDCSWPGSSVHGNFQTRIVEWVAISSSRGSSPPRDRTLISCISGGFFTIEPLRKHFDSIAQFNYVNILEGLLNK